MTDDVAAALEWFWDRPAPGLSADDITHGIVLAREVRRLTALVESQRMVAQLHEINAEVMAELEAERDALRAQLDKGLRLLATRVEAARLDEAMVRVEVLEAELAGAIPAFVARVNARAEADMLAGRPITGAHHRALEAEGVAMRVKITNLEAHLSRLRSELEALRG